MNLKRTWVILLSTYVFALSAQQVSSVTDIPAKTKTEAADTIRGQKLAEQQQRQSRREQLLAVPALLDVEDVHSDGGSVRFRRVAAPALQPQVAPQPVLHRAAKPSRASIPSAPINDSRQATAVTLTLTSADDGDTLLRWQQSKQSWQIKTNADLRGLEGHHRIPYNGSAISVFILNTQAEVTAIPAETHFEILDPQAPDELIKQLKALHNYYLEHRQDLLQQWNKAQALNQAERDWKAANLETPQQTIINFFKIR